jgi:hypothetical protein
MRPEPFLNAIKQEVSAIQTCSAFWFHFETARGIDRGNITPVWDPEEVCEDDGLVGKWIHPTIYAYGLFYNKKLKHLVSLCFDVEGRVFKPFLMLMKARFWALTGK